MIHYFNGAWVTDENLKISVFDLSVARGFGCFDFLRTYQNKPFMLSIHLNRFFNSANHLGLKVPKTKKEIKNIIYTGIKKNNFKETNIKIILTGGPTNDGITPSGQGSLIIIFSPVITYPEKFYQKGIKVITWSHQRFFPEIKSLDYFSAVLAMKEAKRKKAEEALYVNNEQKITEATRANFFAVINQELITPKKGVLIGITREVTLQLAKRLAIKIKERDIYLKEIRSFQEVFLTASNKEIMPVTKINEQIIGDGKVGPITKKLITEFKKFTQRNIS